MNQADTPKTLHEIAQVGLDLMTNNQLRKGQVVKFYVAAEDREKIHAEMLAHDVAYTYIRISDKAGFYRFSILGINFEVE